MRYCYSDVTKVNVIKDYQLHLQFEDGAQGLVNIAEIIPFKGVFEPLKDKDYFSKVFVNRDLGTICWDNGADISPALLHKSIKTNE